MPILDIPYTLLKYKDVYTLENEDIIPITYTLSKVECESITEISTGNILVGATVTLPFSLIDGKYQLNIENVNGEINPVFIYYYNNLLLNIINNVEETICGCGTCKQCDEGDNCDLYLNTITTMLNYFYVNNPTYNLQVTEITTALTCNIDQKILTYLTKKLIRGKENSISSFLQMIGIYYKAFYTTDLATAIDIEEENYIKAKYKAVKIFKCIQNRCITLTGLDNDIASTDNMRVYYWQLDNITDTIEDVIAAFNEVYVTSKPSNTFTNFATGVNINYFNIAKIAFAIKATEPIVYVIKDSLNNDVTDEFDTHYFYDTKSLLFVSKIEYSYSSMTFKIVTA